MGSTLLTVNAGSSSLKIAVYKQENGLTKVASASADHIGSDQGTLAVRLGEETQEKSVASLADHEAALQSVLDRLGNAFNFSDLKGIGHRIVHGGPKYSSSQLVSQELLGALRDLEPFDPEHLPAQVRLIEILLNRFPGYPNVACFDTAFHRDLPEVARRLAVPRRLDAYGVRRYGFHGLSYAFLLEEVKRIEPQLAHGRLVFAHLGNGASLAAIRDGKCIDTSMALTPAAGIPMGTRSGDLDPGLLNYLSRVASMSIEDINRMVHLESGLLGVSERSSDMRDLLNVLDEDEKAEEAVNLFCYQVRKWVGSYAAALGGLDMVVFAGGIGEHAPEVRSRICKGLEFLGIELDANQNEANASVISTGAKSVVVRVIPTDEERMIAQEVQSVLTA